MNGRKTKNTFTALQNHTFIVDFYWCVSFYTLKHKETHQDTKSISIWLELHRLFSKVQKKKDRFAIFTDVWQNTDTRCYAATVVKCEPLGAESITTSAIHKLTHTLKWSFGGRSDFCRLISDVFICLNYVMRSRCNCFAFAATWTFHFIF